MGSGSESSEKTASQYKPQHGVRYEILVPTRDDDGNRFPEHLFIVTGAQIQGIVGALSMGDVRLGTYTMANGTIAVDETIPFIVDIPIERKDDTDIALVKLKKTLAKRFKQEEIYIISHKIEVL